MKNVCILLAALFTLDFAAAQTTDSLPIDGGLRPKMAATIAVARYVTLKKGTLVTMRFNQNISSDNLREGQTVKMDIDQDVRVDDRVVIATDRFATIVVKENRPQGSMGRPARLVLEGNFATAVDGQTIELEGTWQPRKGIGSQGIAWTSTILAVGGVAVTAATGGLGALLLLPIAPAGFLIKGKKTGYEIGEVIQFRVKEDVVIKS